MEVQFYHLLTTSLQQALPKLLEKALAGQYRVLVKCADDLVQKLLDDHLWSYDPGSFLPHGMAKGEKPEAQPILLTTGEENLNAANLLAITDGSELEAEVPGFTRVLDIFNGGDDAQITAARARWKAYKEKGWNLSYIKQQHGGGWKVEAA